MKTWRLVSLIICHLQARDLGKAGGIIKSESKVWEPGVLSADQCLSSSRQAGRTKFCLPLPLCSTQPLDQLYDAHPHEEGKLLH